MELVAFESRFVRLKAWQAAYGISWMVPDDMPYAICHTREAQPL